MRKYILLVTAIFLDVASGSPKCHAGNIYLQTPAALNPGDHFRFVFVTDGAYTAKSTNISDYDKIVNDEANSLNNASYNGVNLTWQVIASTPSVSARDHIGQSLTDQVFLVTGERVAFNTTLSGLWSGTILHPINSTLTQSNLHIFGERAWSGSISTGAINGGLGGPIVATGTIEDSDSRWTSNRAFSPLNGATHRLYAISNEITLSSNTVPEPSTLVGGTLGVIICALAAFARKSKTPPTP